MTETKVCPRCFTEKPVSGFGSNRARTDGLASYCKPCQNAATADHAQRLRMQVIEVLGGPVCVRCQFDDVRALTIDHVDGGGTQHRRDAVSAWSVYQHALDNPGEYQVLCWNCNHIKRHENGEWASKVYREKVLANRRVAVTNPRRWARDFDACVSCGTTETQHQGQGECQTCYQRSRRSNQMSDKDREQWKEDRARRARERREAPKGWSRHYDTCVICGKTDSKHASQGRCYRCYNEIKYRERKEQPPVPFRRSASTIRPEGLTEAQERSLVKARTASAEKRRGTQHTEEHRAKISKGLRRSYAEGKRKAGHSEETKAKISAAKKITGWSSLFDACVSCGMTDSPHKAKGACSRCYYRALRRAKGIPSRSRMPDSCAGYHRG